MQRHKAEKELLGEFLKDQEPLLRRRVNTGLLIGGILVPLFGWTDYILYHEHFGRFMSYRLLATAACLVLYIINRRWNLGYRSFYLGLAEYYIVGLIIIKMILDTNGYASPYYAGLNLVFLTFGTVLTARLKHIVLHTVILYVLFIGSVLLFGNPEKLTFFLGNNTFVISTIIITLVASFVNHNLRWTGFLLRAELVAAQEELVRRERFAVLGKLIAIVSHELRNPLGTIRASLFAIDERVRGKGFGVERPLDRAERNIIRCDKIIEELLDYVRSHDLDLEPTPLDKWLAELLDEQSIPEEIEFTRKLDSGVVVKVDRERFRRCLLNVIGNACQAMVEKDRETGAEEPGREKKGLRVETLLVDERLEIRVIDTGAGIQPDELEKIFQPLYSTKGFGVGLGLPIVKQIMEQHGGGVEIESKPGKGTTVTLWLPTGKEQDDLS